MIVTSKDDVRKDITDEYIRTRNYKYIEEWLKSSGPVVYSMRIANMLQGKHRYLNSILDSDVPRAISNEMSVNNPDILSYAYISLARLIKYWNPDKLTLESYIYSFVTKETLKIIWDEANTGPQRGDNLSLDVMLESNHTEIGEDKTADFERTLVVTDLKESIGIWAREIDIHILDQEMGIISTDTATELMGYTSKSNYFHRKRKVLSLARNYIKENYRGENIW